MGSAKSRPHLKALTGLRFFAALYVVIHHTWEEICSPWPRILRNFVHCGYIGVSLFFVLSGFILVYTYENKAGLRAFWSARFARIYPVYFLGLIISVPYLIVVLLQETPLTACLKQVAPVFALAASLLQAWSPSLVLKLNPPGWSLSAETFFYILFPFILPLIWRITERRIWIAGFFVWILACLPSVLYFHFNPDGLGAIYPGTTAFWLNVIKFHPVMRLPEFILGMMAGTVFLKRDSHGKSSAMPLVTVLFIAAVIICSSKVPYVLLAAGMISPVFVLLVYGLASYDTAIGRFLSRPVMLQLGQASYALYILHLPVWFWMVLIAGKMGFVGADESVTFVLIYMVICVGLSIAVLHLIEEPARKLIRNLSLPRARTLDPNVTI